MDHIALSRWADVIIVAPATANTISKLSQGSSEDLASTVILASNKQVFLAACDECSECGNTNQLKII